MTRISPRLTDDPKENGTLVNGPMEVPGGSMVAQLTDPQGAMFALHMNGAAAE